MNYQFNKEIYYDYGKYINLNGIDPQEIVENIQNAGSRKNKVTINCVVQEGEDKQWYLVFTPSATINDILNIKFIVSNENGTIEDQIEIKPTDTEITYHSPVYKYCTVIFPKTQYTSKTTRYYTNFINPNGNGIFEVNLLKYKDNKEHNTDLNQFKYNTEVVLPIEIIEGCDFVNWEINIGENTETGNTSEITFMMPEDNVTIKCYYNIQKFTITWQNENSEILEVDNNVHYGNIPSYNGETPTKEETEEFTYTFNSWSPKITTATGNTTYVATYTSQKRVYTITWLNYNNELIDTTEVEYGVIPTHIEPTREATAQYTYTFKSWEPKLSEVVGNAEYKASYNTVVNQYIIQWLDWDNQVLTATTVEYGTTPIYPNAEPTREATAKYSFKFVKWIPELIGVTGSTEYKAIYKETINQYPLTINLNNGVISNIQIISGNSTTINDNIVYDYGTIVNIELTANEGYSVNGGKDNTIVKLFENIEITDNTIIEYYFNVKTYTIQWLDWDDQVLTATTVEYGTTPIYPNTEPTREATAQYTYTFKSWEPTVSEVIMDTEYVAVYDSIENEYTVEWYNCDNTLITNETVKYGVMPTIPEEPTYEKPHYICEFIGWDKQVTIVTGDTQYIAQYSETPLQYTIIVNVENGTYDITPEKDSYTYGEKVVITINPFEGYNYEELTDEIDITGNMTLNYECTPNEYNLIINNVSYGKQEYGSDISQYLTYEPQEGMIHKWMEGKTTFTGTTMPSRDLILREVWVSASETNVVYYGGMIISDAKNITSEEVLNLQNFEYENGEVFNTTYNQATLNDETIWATYPNRGDKTAWRNEHGSVLYIAIPKECNVEVKDNLGASYILEKQPNTLIIEGHEYDHYIDTPADPARPSSTPASLNIKITITK